MTDAPSWSDEPVTRVAQDDFGRAPFAKLVAESIDAVQPGSASTVFGLVGQWGSGKSSVAGMVADALPESWTIQAFTPWAASGIAELQLEFVAALDAALGGGLKEKESSRKALKRYVDWVRPLMSAAPGPVRLVADLAENAASTALERKPWSVEFEALAQGLQSMKKRVLIVCDDIDRLDATELLQFLKVVRLLGRFPNVHYLIAYDGDTVEDLLAAEGISGRTSSFMEKIVQHPFELPRIDFATRWRHVSGALKRAITDHATRLDEQALERYRLLVDSLAEGFTTPRQIARYEQHLQVHAKLIPGEIDLFDFAALAYLRLNHHDVYEALPSWTSDLSQGLATGKGGLSREDWSERIAATSRRADISGVWAAISFLFPSVRGASHTALHPQAFADPGLQSARAGQRRLGHPHWPGSRVARPA